MKHNRLIADAFAYTFAGYLVQPLALLSSLWIKKTIGPYLSGVIATLAVVAAYFTYSNLGVLTAAERDLPVLLGEDDSVGFARMQGTAFTFTMLSAVILAALMLSGAIAFRGAIGQPLFEGLVAYAVVVVLQQLTFYYLTLLRTRQQFMFLSKVQIFSMTLSSLGNALAVSFFGFRGLLLAAVLLAVAQITWLQMRERHFPPLTVDRKGLKHLLSVGIPLLAFGIVMTTMRSIDNIIVLRFLGTTALGMYSIALMANVLLFSLTNSLSGVLFPRMQIAYGRVRTFETLSTFVVRPTLVMGVMLPILMGLLFLAGPEVIRAFLPQFIPGVPAFKVIVIVSYFFSMFQMSLCFLISINKQLQAVLLIVVGLIVTAGVSAWCLQQRLGIEAIAGAVGVGYVCCFVGVNVFALRHWATWREVKRFLWDATAPLLYSVTLLALLEGMFSQLRFVLASPLWLTGLECVAFGLGYIPLVLFLEPRTGLLAETGIMTAGRPRQAK